MLNLDNKKITTTTTTTTTTTRRTQSIPSWMIVRPFSLSSFVPTMISTSTKTDSLSTPFPIIVQAGTRREQRRIRHMSRMSSNSLSPDDTDASTSSSSSSTTTSLVDPYSEQAKKELFHFYAHHNLLHRLHDDDVHTSLLQLTECVVSWNEKINLVSRKECTVAHVYHKHVMPSVALLPLLLLSSSSSSSSSSLKKKQQQQPQSQQIQHEHHRNEKEDDSEQLFESTTTISSSSSSSSSDIYSSSLSLRVVDIGTGGGFPGLPLALLLPEYQFTLVDSIHKKLLAVSDMASELRLSNVQIHCGRAEEIIMKTKKGMLYHVVLGRSVTALPQFCSWIQDLLIREKKKKEEEGMTTVMGGRDDNTNVLNTNNRKLSVAHHDNEEQSVWQRRDTTTSGSSSGRLIYIIGGDIDPIVQSKIIQDIPIDVLLQRPVNTSDKRALVFSTQGVRDIAKEFGMIDTGRDEEISGKNSDRRRNTKKYSNHNMDDALMLNKGNTGHGNDNNLIAGGRRRRSGGGGGERSDTMRAGRSKKLAKGEWGKKLNDGTAKQRGYDDFQRYESSS